ncbi:MAG: TolC family protein [Pseudomonadales bacterium]
MPVLATARCITCAVALACLSLATSVAAEPLPLDEAEALALAQEPGREALLARAQALDSVAIARSQLPDPSLRLGLANVPIESGGFRTEGMTQVQLGLRQAFPPGATLKLREREYELLSRELVESAEGRRREVLESVRRAWLGAYYWGQAARIIGDSKPFFDDLVTVTGSLYQVGQKSQQDVLRAELELSRLEERLISIDEQRAAAVAALAEWVGGSARRPVAGDLPAWEVDASLEALTEALTEHPALRSAQARIDAQGAATDVARQRYKPGWAVDLGYGYRDGGLPNGESRSDFVSVSVTVDLPFFTANRQDREVAAAVAQEGAAVGTRDALLRQLKSRLDGQFARSQHLERQIDLYQQAILQQSEEHAQAALSAYRSEAGDFADVMRGYIDDLNARLELVRLRVERAKALAALANLGGLSL